MPQANNLQRILNTSDQTLKDSSNKQKDLPINNTSEPLVELKPVITSNSQTNIIKESNKVSLISSVTEAKTEKPTTHIAPISNKNLNLHIDSKDNTPKDSGEYTDREGQESVRIFKNQFFNVKDEGSEEENFEVFEGDSSEYDNEEEEFMVKKFAVAHEDLIKQCASRLVKKLTQIKKQL